MKICEMLQRHNGLSDERERITEDWYKAINEFEPSKTVNYGWILDYAKFRFDWAFEKTRYIEEKSYSLIRLILTVSAGSWAIFSVVVWKQPKISVMSITFATLALMCLVVAGYYALVASSPANHVYPRGEDKAVKYVESYGNEESAKGRLALLLGDSTEQERLLTIEKSTRVSQGIVFIFVAIICFTVSLFSQLFRLP